MEDAQPFAGGTAAEEVTDSVGSGETLEQAVLRVQTLYAIPSGLLVAFIILVANQGRTVVPFSAPDDVASFAIITVLASIPIALIGAAIGIVRGVGEWNERVAANRKLKWWWSLLPVSIAYAILAGAILLGGLEAFEFAFSGLAIDRLQAALICGVLIAVFAYVIVGHAMRLNTTRLLTIIVLVLAMGLYFGAVTSADPQWWTHSFSYLGEISSNVGWLFNGTLIYIGLLVAVWTLYFMNDYRLLVRHGAASRRATPWVMYGILWIGIAAAIVGFFRWQSTPFNSVIHQVAATSMAVVLGGLILSTRWVAPRFPKSYYVLSYLLLGIIVITHVWAQFGKVNTVGMEFVDFGIGLTWLSQFAANTSSMGKKLEPKAFPY